MIKLWSNDTIGIILELPLCQLLTFSQWVTRYGVVKDLNLMEARHHSVYSTKETFPNPRRNACL